uniref:Uncharacterized protein n=1 Tax=Moniliophthora roreri TaxID=221103 RepID=A0A0W0GD67_MONRR
MKKTWMLPSRHMVENTNSDVRADQRWLLRISCNVWGDDRTAVLVGSYGKGPATFFINPLLVFVLSCGFVIGHSSDITPSAFWKRGDFGKFPRASHALHSRLGCSDIS